MILRALAKSWLDDGGAGRLRRRVRPSAGRLYPDRCEQHWVSCSPRWLVWVKPAGRGPVCSRCVGGWIYSLCIVRSRDLVDRGVAGG